MTGTVTDERERAAQAGPAPKATMPPLDARAPRPAVARLRRGVVVGAVLAGAGLVGGSLTWAFVVQPDLRARAHLAGLEGRPAETAGAVRPSERVTEGPASYADVDRLPPPRGIGEAPDAGRADPRVASPGARATPVRVPARSGRSQAGLAETARGSGLFFAGRGPDPADPGRAPQAAQADVAAVYNPHTLTAPLSPYEVKAGAVLAAALLTAIDTSRSGPVTATLTENVFDTVSGRHLLIPQGARLIGRHEGESRHGDRRAFVVWERLILPNGKSLRLPKETGVDAAGAVGVPGKVDRRLGSLALATVFAGAITALGQAARDGDADSGGLLGDAGDAAAIEAAQVGGKLLDRELQVRPSITLRPGARVRVFITRDLVLEPYVP